jgi:hypothetical protein
MNELDEAEIYNYRNNQCKNCSEKDRNCSDEHVRGCISMDYAEKFDEENGDGEKPCSNA